jgi:DNA-binding MarR family transcriptional regulator
MADINFATKSGKSADPAVERGDMAAVAAGDHMDLIELLFFAYRDFVGDPDEILAEIGFGRAHHRVLHFVTRNPGLPVAELLDILKITKQSLARVLRELIESGHIRQETGPTDRRQRLLYSTDAGLRLAAKLAEPQSRRISRALDGLSPVEQEGARAFLTRMMNPKERPGPAGERA